MDRTIITASNKIARLLAYLSGAAMILLIVVLVGNAVMSQFGTPFRATYEMVSALGVTVGGLALAEAQVHKSHIAIDIVVKRMSKSVQLILGTVITVGLVILFTYLAYGMWVYADIQRKTNAATDQLSIPVWLLILPLCIGLIGLVLALFGDLGRVARAAQDENAQVEIW